MTSSRPDPEDDSPGVPGFRTWRGIYLFVLVCFIAVIAALTAFTYFFG